jgi:hypothetical protein
MARGIVRLSLDGPSPNTELQAAKKKLTPTFVASKRTATMDAYGNTDDILAALSNLLDYLQNDLPEGFGLDHLWIYVDKAEPPA